MNPTSPPPSPTHLCVRSSADLIEPPLPHEEPPSVTFGGVTTDLTIHNPAPILPPASGSTIDLDPTARVSGKESLSPRYSSTSGASGSSGSRNVILFICTIALFALVYGIAQCVVSGKSELASIGIGFGVVGSLAALGIWCHYKDKPRHLMALACISFLGLILYGVAQGGHLGTRSNFNPHGLPALGGALLALTLATLYPLYRLLHTPPPPPGGDTSNNGLLSDTRGIIESEESPDRSDMNNASAAPPSKDDLL